MERNYFYNKSAHKENQAYEYYKGYLFFLKGISDLQPTFDEWVKLGSPQYPSGKIKTRKWSDVMEEYLEYVYHLDGYNCVNIGYSEYVPVLSFEEWCEHKNYKFIVKDK